MVANQPLDQNAMATNKLPDQITMAAEELPVEIALANEELPVPNPPPSACSTNNCLWGLAQEDDYVILIPHSHIFALMLQALKLPPATYHHKTCPGNESHDGYFQFIVIVDRWFACSNLDIWCDLKEL